MVLDETPKEEFASTTLTSSADTNTTSSALRRISTISNAVSSQRILNPKKSQRKLQLRPSHPALAHHYAVDHAANTAQMPMKKSSQAPLAQQPKKSRSSIFDLFSRPKVEKSRAYGGEAAITPALPPPKTAAASKSPLQSHPHPHPQPLHSPPPPPRNASLRPPSPQQQKQQPTSNPSYRSSVASHNAKPVASRSLTQRISMQRLKPEDAIPRSDHADKIPAWVPPPLFQAFARSVKNGLAETSLSSPDKHAARLRAAARQKELEELEAKNNRDSLGSDVSGATRRPRSALPPPRALASVHVDVPQKIVVLLDDGHLLQYSQLGPTNRVPEKVLHLGPESAVFLGEVSAQSHGALRIVQNTGTRSFSLHSTVSALSRLTRRSVTTKRDVPNLLFYFSSAEETKDWLEAIRKLIESAGRPGSTSSKDTSDNWQVDSVVGDSAASNEKQTNTATSTSTTDSTSAIEVSRAKALPNTPPPADIKSAPALRHTFDDDSDDSDRKGSLEILEEEADKLLVSPSTRLSVISGNKRVSDAFSFTSSSTPSMDAQVLANLRNSIRMSHTSTVTGMTSRTNSMTSEPSSNKVSLENSADNGSIKSPYRNLQSYQAAKRRSALPMVNTNTTPQPIIELTSPGVTTSSPTQAPTESPLLSAVSPVPTPTSITSSTASRSPVSRSPSTANNTLDVKAPEPLPLESTPTITEEDERPESIVADLPPPSTWTSKLSPKKRASVSAPLPSDRHQFRLSSAPITQTPQQAAASASRRASHGFRIPLKINPNLPNNAPSRNKNRESTIPETASEKPKVFTLEAKVDPTSRNVDVGDNADSNHDSKPRAAQRLSLFPSPLLSQTPIPEQPRVRPASVSRTSQVAPEAVPNRRASLQRPMSLQVRASHAPFLSSARSPTTADAPITNAPVTNAPVTNAPTTDRRVVSSTAIPIRAAPIRQLKPSRSASGSLSNTSRDQVRPASPTDPFTARRGSILSGSGDMLKPRNPYRASYNPGFGPPLAPPPRSSMQLVGNSFAQQKAVHRTSLRPRNSIIAPLSGINMVELGPPAPPPNAPLPAPPDGAPPGILSLGTMPLSPPLKNGNRMSMQVSHTNGLGIRA